MTCWSAAVSFNYVTDYYFCFIDNPILQLAVLVTEADANTDALGAVKLISGLKPLVHAPDADVELVCRIRDVLEISSIWALTPTTHTNPYSLRH